MKHEYKTVDITTTKGIERAEKLHENDAWKMIQSSPFTIQFERKTITTHI